MSMRKIIAVFQKTYKDMLKNKKSLILFFLFPIMALVFYNLIPEEKEFFSTIFLPVHLIIVPASMITAIISEEKEKNTLRQLIMANVTSLEYFIGIGLFVFIISILTTSLFLIIISLSAIEFLRFYIIISLAILCSMVIGAVIGIISKNQMNANAMIMPLSIILGILPIFSAFNDTVKNIASIFYTQTLTNVITSISTSISIKDYAIMFLNILICLIIFTFVFKKKKLDND